MMAFLVIPRPSGDTGAGEQWSRWNCGGDPDCAHSVDCRSSHHHRRGNHPVSVVVDPRTKVDASD